jgi:hypothetical protein
LRLQRSHGVSCTVEGACTLVGIYYLSTSCGSGGCFGLGYPLAEYYRQAKPDATTEAATSVGGAEVTLNASLTANGAGTEYYFEYGQTTSYGQSVPVSHQSIGAGKTGQKVSQSLGGLQADTPYHYRVVAVNEIGTTYGKDETFRTKALTILCKSNPTSSVCPLAERYAAETALKASSAEILKIATSIVTVKCAAPGLEGKTAAQSGYPLATTISALSFSNCGTNGLMNNCTLTPENLPTSASLLWAGGENGTLGLGGVGAKPGWYVKCGEILDCKLRVQSTATLKGGNPAQLALPETTLSTEGGLLCPAKATLNPITYTVNAPKPVYVKRTE